MADIEFVGGGEKDVNYKEMKTYPTAQGGSGGKIDSPVDSFTDKGIGGDTYYNGEAGDLPKGSSGDIDSPVKGFRG